MSMILRTAIFFTILAALWLLAGVFVRLSLSNERLYYPEPRRALWDYQVIDTMKYSRDLAREKLGDPSFDQIIERQVWDIAETGATHVAIATPYDEEFVPFLTRWVKAARANNLSVWFRGNFSGWEEWFGYPLISPEEHLRLTTAFIKAHPELFEDGDLFTACPECENGGPGDPRQTGGVEAFRNFIIASHKAADTAFQEIGVRVDTRLYSMNGDVAALTMDARTTEALGGVITVDHYVKTPEELEQDIRVYGNHGERRVFLGEFGAPIPDIHSSMTDVEQAAWLDQALDRLSRITFLSGLSYWLAVGGSTEIWDDQGSIRPAVHVLKKYYEPNVLSGFINDEVGRAVAGATVSVGRFETTTDAYGHYELPYVEGAGSEVSVTPRALYQSKTLPLPREEEMDIILEPKRRSVPYLFLLFLKEHFMEE